MSGSKTLALEHALAIAEYFGLKKAEAKYFILLVQMERAGSEKLRRYWNAQIEDLRRESQSLERVVPSEKKLTTDQRMTFYSSWYYSAIRVLSSIAEYQNDAALAKRVNLQMKDLNERLNFLFSTGLCRKSGGRIEPGPKYTHLEASSPLAVNHHLNWRMKAIARHPSLSEREVAYTSPMSLSKDDAVKVRKLLVDLVRKVNSVRDPSPCEVAFCLNIDWFEF